MSSPDSTLTTPDEVPALPPEILALMASFEATGAGEDADAGDETAPADTLPPEEPEAGIAAGGESGEIAAVPAPLASSAEEATLVLVPVLDITAAAALHAELLARRGQPLAVDASGVKRLGAQCLQLLLSAAATFRHDDVPLRMGAASEAFGRDLALLGFASPDVLFREAA